MSLSKLSRSVRYSKELKKIHSKRAEKPVIASTSILSRNTSSKLVKALVYFSKRINLISKKTEPGAKDPPTNSHDRTVNQYGNIETKSTAR
mmetsp:Transcript_27342/g.44428  ORF Transcript_27342/g.44428 Transcript_27342/m.44428 type:complete len:91 (+) Transcript_27342:935-1207(+)